MNLNETVDRLTAFATRDGPRRELGLWLEQESWDARRNYARQLAFAVLRLFAEADNGDWRDDELRKQVFALVAPENFGPVVVIGSRIADNEILDEPVGLHISEPM